MAKAFFKMSRCLVTAYSSARTPANSLASCTALASPQLAPFGLRPREPTPAPPSPMSFFHRVKLQVETPSSRDNCARLGRSAGAHISSLASLMVTHRLAACSAKWI